MNKVTVEYAFRGTVLISGHGYMLKLGDNVAAFYLDALERAYPEATHSTVVINGEYRDYPSISISDDTNAVWSKIYFPEFAGWRVHCVSGGKTLSICLTKNT